MKKPKPMSRLITFIFCLFITNISFAKEINSENNHNNTDTKTEKLKDISLPLINPENELITGFLVEIKNHKETNLTLLENAYVSYFENNNIETRNIISTTNSKIIYIIKSREDTYFYLKFGKIVS